MNHSKRQYRSDGWHTTKPERYKMNTNSDEYKEFVNSIPAGQREDDTHTVVTRYQDCHCPDCGHKAIARLSTHIARDKDTDFNYIVTTIKCFNCGYGYWYIE
jgi:predicted RNA-binding Zn-ribbon protein involved in translation (DUF1610 family)